MNIKMMYNNKIRQLNQGQYFKAVIIKIADVYYLISAISRFNQAIIKPWLHILIPIHFLVQTYIQLLRYLSYHNFLQKALKCVYVCSYI